eukprot:TRINITY_DN10529_c0_g2_i1.p1 TRINITY_DN10529_c0_g2~~TRINITY_DN10529_c0_g2_i1.p1  ORF type:complete len:694 (+),score=204.43 TRINITY_DN10529_c0_g2_i1:107-2188(+)
MRVSTAFIAALCFALAFAKVNLPRKQLGGPPSEFARMTIPDPTQAALFHDSALFFVQFSEVGENLWSYEQDFAVDSSTLFSLAIVTSLDEHADVSLTDPNGAAFDLEKYATKTYWPVGDRSIETTVYEVPNPTVGTYKLAMTVSDISKQQFASLTSRSQLRAQPAHHGLVILDNDSQDEIYSHLSTYRSGLRQNDDLKVVARMYDETANPNLEENKGYVPKALGDIVSTAQLEVIYPDGSIRTSDMHDDGLHADQAAGDGVYGGDFVAEEAGYYLVQTVMKGTNAAGNAFVRTAEHQVKVVPNEIQFTGKADLGLDWANQRVKIDLEVTDATADEEGDGDAGTYRAHLQLYGHSLLTGNQVPIAWASSVVDTVATTMTQSITLEVDFGWLVKAAAAGPFVVKDAFLQEINTFAPVAETDKDLRLPYSAHLHARLNETVTMLTAGDKADVTPKMRFGVPPVRNQTHFADGSRHLVLLHGYCADKNPWESHSEDWPSDAVYVHDFQQSRSHDQYAGVVADFIASKGLQDYSLIGHSQGGIVTLHTYNFYWSGLDNSPEGVRKIQSLASPYQGNSAAGAWAELLDSLEGCGSNSDLSRDGAELWLSSVSPAAAAEQHYYTTQYDKGGLFGGGYCNALVNAIMKTPNDGATENIYATLDGATYVDNFVGECHIEDMNWPPSFWDTDRNAEMRAAAGF